MIENDRYTHPILIIQSFHRHINYTLTTYHERTTALHHGHFIAVFEVVLRNIMSRITASYDDSFLARGIVVQRAVKLRGVD